MLAGILGMTLMLSGCFFSEQTLVIGPDGKADIKVEFWFNKTRAGDEGSIAMQEFLYLFPELQDYETTRAEKDIGYTTYLVYRFQANNVDISKNRYIDFVKKDDGSYSLTIRIPKAIEEKKESNDKVLTIKVTMPAEIDMANTMNYEGRTAEWELRQNDFSRDIILKTFTKVPSQEEIEKEMGEETSFEREGNIYIKNAEGKVQALTNTGKDSQPCLSPNGKIVVFIRSTGKNISEPSPFQWEANEIRSINLETGEEKLLIRGRKADSVEDTLSDLTRPCFSPDGQKIYFMSSAWATSLAIHVMNSDGTEEQFLTSGDSLEVLQEGEYGDIRCEGYLIVEKHKYFLGGGSYDWHWLLSPDGKEVGPINDVELFKEMYVKNYPEGELKEQKEQQEPKKEISYFSMPKNAVKIYYEAVFFKQDKSLAKTCYSKATSLLLEETISSPVEIKNRLEGKGIGFGNYAQKILMATYSIDKEWLEKSADPENERLVKVEFNEELLNWKVVKEGDEWKIAMPVAVTQEQGEIWLKSTPEVEPFFDLSEPENTLRSFMEASCSGDEEAAKGCWSSRMPETLVESMVSALIKSFGDAHPEFLKFLVRGTHYRSEKINEDNYYAFTISPGSKKRSKTIVFRVIRENDHWKILIPKGMEDDPSFSILMELLGID